jgi:hypothetical protein
MAIGAAYSKEALSFDGRIPSTLNATMRYDIIALAAGMHPVAQAPAAEPGSFALRACISRLYGLVTGPWGTWRKKEETA